MKIKQSISPTNSFQPAQLGFSTTSSGTPLAGEYKLEKLSTLQKNLLVRWINTLDVCENYLSLENIIEELKSGILLCNIQKFHQPNLDFTGVNEKARAKKQCLNNIERALSILYQKGAPSRFIPTAEEIFEGDRNPEKIWILLRTVFDVFAMHDVSLLLSKIVKWLNKSLSYFPGVRVEALSSSPEEIYQEFKSGVDLACILALYGPQDSDEYLPDFRMIYQFPQNRQELMTNLSYVFNLAIKNNVPIYLKPAEYLDFEQHNFLLLQLYYLYCKFKNSKPAFSRRDISPQLIFKDDGRILEDNSQTSGGMSSSQQTNNQNNQNNITSPQTQVNSSSGSRSGTVNLTPTPPQRSSQGPGGGAGAGQDSEDQKTSSMGIIDEVDSVDFSSTMKSSQRQYQVATPASQDANGIQTIQIKGGKINHQKVQAFLQQQNLQVKDNPIMNSSKGRNQQSNPLQTPQRPQNILSPNDRDEEDGNVGGGSSDARHEEDTFSGRPLNQNQRFGASNGSRSALNQQQLNQKAAPLMGQVKVQNFLETSMRQNAVATYGAVVDENIGIFSSQLEDNTLNSPPLFKQQQQQQHEQRQPSQRQPQIIKAQQHIEERKAFFMEDLRSQLLNKGQAQGKQYHQTNQNTTLNRSLENGMQNVSFPNAHVNEDQLLQMYYSSAGGVNQTAQFVNNNNFNTLDTVNVLQPSIQVQQPQIDHQAQLNNSLLPSTSQYVPVVSKFIRDINDENGELDEIKCISFVSIPQLATVQVIGGNQTHPQKAYIVVKPLETCFTELSENYTLKILDPSTISRSKPRSGFRCLYEIKISQIESILMKNLVQKQFMITWQPDNQQQKGKILIETSDKSDNFFQALNLIHSRRFDQ